MVGSRASSQASAKKQQSISSFFTKNAATKPPPALTPKTSNGSNGALLVHRDESLFLRSDEEDNPHLDKSTSSSTPKHFFNEDGEYNHEDSIELPARKRIRLSESRQDSQGTTFENHLISTSANEIRKPKPPQHTSKYAFSSSPNRDEDNSEEDDETKRRKERLHEKFVKKLGRPESIAEIKRRNWAISEETAQDQSDANDDDDDDAGEDAVPEITTKGRKGPSAKKGASKLTPMEKQFLDIKRKNMDTLMIMEVGYKYKFWGEDARVAAKELSIVCIPGKFRFDEHPSEAHLGRFASASIPTHRLHVHVKRLVGAGHKVGIIRQLETAALKAAGDNRNAPFVRKLTNLYTKGTYIDDVEGLEASVGSPAGGTPATGYLVCITESNAKGWGTDEKVHIGLVAVQPATGDVIHDDFEDGFMRSEIETRLLHIAPCEILIVGDLSKATDKLVQHLSGSKTNVFGAKVRLERIEKPKTMAAQAYSHVSNFYAEKMKASSAEEDEKASKILDNVLKLAEGVTICLSAMITHLTDYGLQHVFDLTKYFQSFSARSHMLLNGTSLTSLEIYQNQTDHTEKGSLFWTLDRTKTRFGQRLLRKWVGRPLLRRAELEERVFAVEELNNDQRTTRVDRVKHLLSQIRSDLEKSLIRIYYGKVGTLPPSILFRYLFRAVCSPGAIDRLADYATHRHGIRFSQKPFRGWLPVINHQ